MSAERPAILLVEDDGELRMLLAELLRDAGYTVVATENGARAIDALQVTSGVGLILLDLMMPVMDGFAFRAHQVKDPAIAEIPVILMSADRGAALRAEGLGAAASLRKPVEVERLLDLVARYC